MSSVIMSFIIILFLISFDSYIASFCMFSPFWLYRSRALYYFSQLNCATVLAISPQHIYLWTFYTILTGLFYCLSFSRFTICYFTFDLKLLIVISCEKLQYSLLRQMYITFTFWETAPLFDLLSCSHDLYFMSIFSGTKNAIYECIQFFLIFIRTSTYEVYDQICHIKSLKEILLLSLIQ